MDEGDEDTKFINKLKREPAVPIGMAGFTGIVIYGLYNFRKRTIAPSLYLINLRLAAQGTVLGCITLGLVYSMFQNHKSKLFGTNEKK